MDMIQTERVELVRRVWWLRLASGGLVALGAPIETSLEPPKEAFEVFEKCLNNCLYTNPVDDQLICCFCEGGCRCLGPLGSELKARHCYRPGCSTSELSTELPSRISRGLRLKA